MSTISLNKNSDTRLDVSNARVKRSPLVVVMLITLVVAILPLILLFVPAPNWVRVTGLSLELLALVVAACGTVIEARRP